MILWKVVKQRLVVTLEGQAVSQNIGYSKQADHLEYTTAQYKFTSTQTDMLSDDCFTGKKFKFDSNKLFRLVKPLRN